jgi:hypothetical protein
MTYRGHIKNGVAILDSRVELPDGTRVRVEVEKADSDFWENKTIDDLARQQGVDHPQKLTDLRFDWPDDESIDDFLNLVREVRH